MAGTAPQQCPKSNSKCFCWPRARKFYLASLKRPQFPFKGILFQHNSHYKMALIYASAVNRRMNALHKKHSVDIPPAQHAHEIVHCKQRSNEERQPIGGTQQAREASNDRKSSAPPAANRVNGTAGGSINPNSSKIQCQQQSKRSGEHARVCRKMTVAGGQVICSSAEPTLSASHRRRKISTPVMVQSVTGTLTGCKKQSSKEGSPDSDEDPVATAKNLLASFGRVIRRRSVSADDAVHFRKRNGTNSSLDSSQGEDSPGARKTSAFQRMKERLNKWKLSG